MRARSNPGEGVNVAYQHHKGEMSHNKATKGIKHHQEEEDHHRNEEIERSSEESSEVLNHGIRYSGTGLGPLPRSCKEDARS